MARRNSPVPTQRLLPTKLGNQQVSLDADSDTIYLHFGDLQLTLEARPENTAFIDLYRYDATDETPKRVFGHSVKVKNRVD